MHSEAEEYIQKKFRRLERHLKLISDAKIEVSRTSARSQTERIVAQMTLLTNGYTLRGQESGANLFTAIDAVTNVMDRQIQRFKGKVYRSGKARRSARAAVAQTGDLAASQTAGEEAEDGFVPELGTVVRTKRFRVKPMTVQDAIIEMELLSHDFFFFRNVDTNEYNVVYRRHDGDHGLIEPEMA